MHKGASADCSSVRSEKPSRARSAKHKGALHRKEYMPLFERMICNFCEIDDIQCLRIDLKSLLQWEKGDRLRWMRCQGKECRSEKLMKRKQTPHPSYSQNSLLIFRLPCVRGGAEHQRCEAEGLCDVLLCFGTTLPSFS